MSDTKTITKSLAGIEDLLIGVDTVQQNRAGSVVEVHCTHQFVPVSSEDKLAALDPTKYALCAIVTDQLIKYYKFSATEGAKGVASTFGGVWVLLNKADVELSSEDGAKLVNYKANVVGSKLRSVDSRLNDCISVTDFGAIGDGVTDNTTALNAALASGNSLLFPPGVYLCKSTLLAKKPNCTVYSQGNAEIRFDLKEAGDAGILVTADSFSAINMKFTSVIRVIAISVKPSYSADILGLTVRDCKFEDCFYAVQAGNLPELSNSGRVKNISIVNCESRAPVRVNAGHFVCIHADNIIYANNSTFGGLNTSAYGATDCSRIVISNNIELGVADTVNNIEASAQIEDSPEAKAVIEGNSFSHDIWVSGATDVTIANNICRELRVTSGNFAASDSTNVTMLNNIAQSASVDFFNKDSVIDNVRFLGNTFSSKGKVRAGSALTYTLYLSMLEGAKTIVFENNTVLSDSSGYCIRCARDSSGLNLHLINNKFGNAQHIISGKGGCIYEHQNSNPLFAYSGANSNYISSGVKEDYASTLYAYKAVKFSFTANDVNEELVDGIFTPKQTGVYKIDFSVATKAAESNTILATNITIDSAVAATTSYTSSAVGTSLVHGAADLYVRAGQKVAVNLYADKATNVLTISRINVFKLV